MAASGAAQAGVCARECPASLPCSTPAGLLGLSSLFRVAQSARWSLGMNLLACSLLITRLELLVVLKIGLKEAKNTYRNHNTPRGVIN